LLKVNFEDLGGEVRDEGLCDLGIVYGVRLGEGTRIPVSVAMNGMSII
jgi:hypothetical protein